MSFFEKMASIAEWATAALLVAIIWMVGLSSIAWLFDHLALWWAHHG